MKTFEVPIHYRSPLITELKRKRKEADKMKKDFSPSVLKFGKLDILLARHFGFCYGVENAIEIAFKALDENPDKRIFLLSEMIHNPGVNADLQARGVQFLMDTKGNKIMDWDTLTPNDVVIIPAFGTTIELAKELENRGIIPTAYETTCPFVEKVWNRASKIGMEGYTVVVHGKPNHEETRATFSHSKENTPTVVVEDMKEAILLGKFITGEIPAEKFYTDFDGHYSAGFDAEKDLRRIGVVNQTTMLAEETQAIAEYLKHVMVQHYALPADKISAHFADNRDTLCYATNDNQSAVKALLHEQADFALVIGGYNSSNTSHLVELCMEKLPTYFIEDASKFTAHEISHFDLHIHSEKLTEHFIPKKEALRVMITSGASCPDALVEEVIMKLKAIYETEH